MAEYIDRNSLGIGKCNPDVFEDKGYAKGWNAAIDIVQNAPAADVRPVVTCADCKFNKREVTDLLGNDAVQCITGQTHRHDWFCADGEKREES